MNRSRLLPRSAEARRERRQFITHNAVAAAGTFGAGLFGLVLQALVSHHFRPAEYGQAFAVFSFYTILSQPAYGFGRLITWSTSRARGTDVDEQRGSSALLRSTNRRLLVGGTGVALVFILAAPLIAEYLHVPSSFVILGALGLPFFISSPPLLASLQGQERWLSWSVVSTAIASTRVVCVLGLVIPFGLPGVLLGISVAAALMYVGLLIMVWPRLQQGRGVTSGWRQHWRFLVLSLASGVTVSVAMGSDVVIVQHLFGSRAGGEFSSVAVTTRTLYFLLGSVASVLLPKVASRHATARGTMPLVVGSVAIAVVASVVALLVFSAGGHLFLHYFSGRAYEGGSGYIGWYAMGMPLLAGVTMLTQTQQSLSDLGLLWVLIPGTLLKPVLILFFHHSLLMVSVMSDVSIAALLAALTVRYLIWERRRERALPRPSPPEQPVEAPAVIAPHSAGIALVSAAPTTSAKLAGALRLARRPDWWRDRTRWMVERPKAVIVAVALLGIAVRQAWISVMPLAAGDWAWRSGSRLSAFFPWPSVWDPTLSIGGANRFLAAFRFPVYAVSGVLAQLGASWTLIEKVLFFIPYAALLPVAGWLFAREIMGRTRWTLLTPLLLLGNTYFLVEANGEIPLTLSEAIGILALLGFLRAMRQRSVGWALITGLLVAVACTFDIRPAYLCLVLMAMYFVILALTSLEWQLLGRRALLGLLTVATFVGTQAFWVLPLLNYHGNPGFPVPPTPDFSILTLGHGLTGVVALWTGGLPAVNVQAPLNPMFMILPILALTPLLARRLTPEVLWLGLAALLFAVFVNTDNAPLGAVYDWMYAHVPGWNLFREGSKFLFVVGVAYAILIPIALRAAFTWAASRPRGRRTRAVRGGAVAALAGVVVLSSWSIGVLESGKLQSTTNPTTMPASFSALAEMLGRDTRPGAVLWFGQPVTTEGLRHHTFIIASPTHPEVNLPGQFNPANDVTHRDPFQLYCADNVVPYCYLDPQLFPYLTRISEAGYVVVPGGQATGTVPRGITRFWLQQQVASMFGQPVVLGSGTTELLVWRLPPPAPAVTTAPAIAVVNGGTWTAPSVLPALEALDIPAAYRQSFDNGHYPAAPAGLPDSIAVLPRADGGCTGASPASVAVMAQSTASSLPAIVAGAQMTLPLLTVPSRLSGWGIYGPVDIRAGQVPIAAVDTATTLGPCMAWSSLAQAALAGRSTAVAHVAVEANGERLTASSLPAGDRWAELHRFHDPGWQLSGKPSAGTGDGLFNLYHLNAASPAPSHLTFAFSTIGWERIGLIGSVLVLVVTLTVAVRDLRRRRFGVPEDEMSAPLVDLGPSTAGRWIASIGVAMLIATAVAVTVEWFGLPSALPGTAVASDPYGLDVGYGVTAIGLLLLSLVVRVAMHLVRAREARHSMPSLRLPSRVGATATMLLVVAVLVTACAQTPGDLQSMLSKAQQAGAVSPSIEGGSFEEARLQRAAHQPKLCIADYTRALAAFPQVVQGYVGRADCYTSGGKNSAAAVHDYSAAISLSPANSSLFFRRAAADRASGNLAAAISDYQAAGLAPGSPPSRQLSAIDGLLAMDEYTAARTVYQAASARHPRSAIVQLAAADIAIATGADTAAEQAFATALQFATNKGEVGHVVAQLCHHEVLRHLYTKAAIDCANAAQIAPQASGAYDDLSAAQLALGNPSTALADINAAVGAWIGGTGVYAQAAGVDGLGLAQLYSARAWIEVQLHSIRAAVADFQQAQLALPTPAPDVRARLKAAITTAIADG